MDIILKCNPCQKKKKKDAEKTRRTLEKEDQSRF